MPSFLSDLSFARSRNTAINTPLPASPNPSERGDRILKNPFFAALALEITAGEPPERVPTPPQSPNESRLRSLFTPKATREDDVFNQTPRSARSMTGDHLEGLRAWRATRGRTTSNRSQSTSRDGAKPFTSQSNAGTPPAAGKIRSSSLGAPGPHFVETPRRTSLENARATPSSRVPRLVPLETVEEMARPQQHGYEDGSNWTTYDTELDNLPVAKNTANWTTYDVGTDEESFETNTTQGKSVGWAETLVTFSGTPPQLSPSPSAEDLPAVEDPTAAIVHVFNFPATFSPPMGSLRPGKPPRRQGHRRTSVSVSSHDLTLLMNPGNQITLPNPTKSSSEDVDAIPPVIDDSDSGSHGSLDDRLELAIANGKLNKKVPEVAPEEIAAVPETHVDWQAQMMGHMMTEMMALHDQRMREQEEPPLPTSGPLGQMVRQELNAKMHHFWHKIRRRCHLE